MQTTGGDNMAKAPGFMLYDEKLDQLELLTDEEAGKVIKAAGLYKRTGEVTELSRYEMLVFLSLQRDIDLNNAKYDAICERNRANGEKGGAPVGNQNARKTTQNDPEQPTGLKNNPKQANINPNINPNENQNLNENSSTNETEDYKVSGIKGSAQQAAATQESQSLVAEAVDFEALRRQKLALLSGKG